MTNHKEISPVILLDEALDFLFFSAQASSNYPNRHENDPIASLEMSYSISSIILLFSSIEGYINRIIYLSIDEDPELVDFFEKTVESKLGKILAQSEQRSDLLQDFDELCAVRNALAHAHIYESERDEERKIIDVQERILRKDARWSRTVNDQNRFRTNRLAINVIPSEISFIDSVKFFRFWGKLYDEMNELSSAKGYLPSGFPFIFRRSQTKVTQDMIDCCNCLDGNLGCWVDLAEKISKSGTK